MTEERKICPVSTPIADIEWSKTTIPSEPDPNPYSQPDTLFTCYIDGGFRLTVLDRETGYGGGGVRDVETGLRHADGGWWLASGMCDVRLAPEVKTIEDAIAWVMEHANTCRGD